MRKRVFLIVCDSFGVGELPDAAAYGDAGSNTLAAVAKSDFFDCPTLEKMGLFHIDGASGRPATGEPDGAYGKAAERSAGKDTTTGHWELAGLLSERPFPTYPDGFPQEILDAFCAATGRGVLCNKPYSGTEVIRDYGDEQIATGKWIVYTSADSVFQIAAHTDVIPLAELYAACETARKILTGRHAVGRVIARPFAGAYPFYRTPDRHDYSLKPPSDTLLDVLKNARKDVIAVGKIHDIFAGKGVTETYRTKDNDEGMAVTLRLTERDFDGLCFVNLVDFDMKYGHRNDVDGYARALTRFDGQLGRLREKLWENDLLIVTADHGCDPSTKSTDHSREHVPVLVYGRGVLPHNLGVRETFADVAASICAYFSLPQGTLGGVSFL